MNTKNDAIQIFGILMKKPHLLSQIDKYNLSISDFSTTFERYIFDTIEGLYHNGANKIQVIDIANAIESNPTAKRIFEQNKGIEYLEDALDFSEEDNFDYYYSHLKKINALNSLKRMGGVDISEFYCEDLTNPKATEINKEFERLTVNDIFKKVKSKILNIEKNYLTDGATESSDVFDGLEDLLSESEVGGDVGMPLQGTLTTLVMGGARKGTFMLRSAGSGTGKALPNSTKIPTPIGWRQVGEIKKGDYLFDAFGKPTKVLEVYPQGIKEVYQVTFKDGRTARCCDEHLWSYNTYTQKESAKNQRKFYTKTLKEIAKEPLQSNSGAYRILVPMQKAVEYKEKNHYLPPYVMGLLLGDGSFKQHPSNKSLQFSSEDSELPETIGNTMNWFVKKNSANNYIWYFSTKNTQDKAHEKINVWVEDALKEHLDLINTNSKSKFIPRVYIEDSIENRYELLRGLLDSDGHVDDKGRVSYYTISEKLRDDFIEVARSLGFKTHVIIDNHKETNVGYMISIQGKPEDKIKLFKLKRKKTIIEKWYNSTSRFEKNTHNPIVKIEKLNYSEEMTCFYVDNKEHLFLTEDFIVTHNTRRIVGDACFLAFPFRFNFATSQWEQKGNSEKVLYIATEQNKKEIQRMVLAYVTGINESKFRYGQFTELERKVIAQAKEIIKQYKDNLIITQMPSPTNELLQSIVREQVILNNISYVFFDYVFISPALINEFKGMSMRNDELLLVLTTTLKNLATELNVFVMSATQVNANADDNKNIRNEASLAGGRSQINKCDYGMIMARPTNEELGVLEPISAHYGIVPNLVTDVYKVRAGEWTQVRIWSYFDAGILRTQDLFMTDSRFNVIDLSNAFTFDYDDWESEERMAVLKQLNDQL